MQYLTKKEISSLLQQNSKIYDLNPGWFWSGEVVLPPAQYFILNKKEVPDPEKTELVSDINGWRLLRSTDVQAAYAAVLYEDGTREVCQAKPVGGIISVTCANKRPGILQIYEYNRGHWHVSVNGNNDTLVSNRWLQVPVPAGTNTVIFHYYPWYASLYIGMLCLGIIASLLFVVRPQLIEVWLQSMQLQGIFNHANEA